MLNTYVKTAWRNLKAQKGITAINLVGLSTGMTAAVLIMLWVQNELSFDQYHSKSSQIYRITNTLHVNNQDKWVWDNSPLLLGQLAQERLPGIEKVARLYISSWDKPTIRIKDQTYRQGTYAIVDGAWFDIFNYNFVRGSAKEFNADPFSIALTESKAKTWFGNNDPIGAIVLVDTVQFTVRAVLKDNPTNSSFQFDMLVPLESRLYAESNRKNDSQWGNFNYMTYFQLSPSTSPKKIEKGIEAIYRDKRGTETKIDCKLLPLHDLHFEQELQNPQLLTGDRKLVYAFSILAGLLLVTACINYVNLTTARATLRAKEVSVKKIIGARRFQLFLQFVIESIFVSVLALAFTLLLTTILLPYFNQLTDKNFSLPVASPIFWLIVSGTLLTSILFNSLYPALLLSSFQPISIFRGMNALKIKDGLLRKGLVVLQFTFTIALIVGSIVVYRQMKYVREKDPGYDRSLVFTASIPIKWLLTLNQEKRESIKNTIKSELLKSSAIKNVSVARESIVNMGSSTTGTADWQGRAKDFNPVISRFAADHAFADLFAMHVKEGRWFQENNKADEKNFILNETAVKEFGLKKPVIGQRFSLAGDTGQIIGVVQDIHYKSFKEKIGAMVFFNRSSWAQSFYIKPAPGQTARALEETRRIWAKLITGQPFEYSFVQEEYENLYRAEQRAGVLLTIFSGIAILIACMGLFGLATFASQQRSKEIGIRKVLGASVQNIVRLLSTEFVLLIIIAAVIATPIAWYFMNQWLQDFQYRISISGATLTLAAFIALSIALVTVSFQAIKAALMNPVKSIRNE